MDSLENLRVLEGSEVFFRGLQHPAINGHIRLINRMILQGKVSVSTGTLFSY